MKSRNCFIKMYLLSIAVLFAVNAGAAPDCNPESLRSIRFRSAGFKQLCLNYSQNQMWSGALDDSQAFQIWSQTYAPNDGDFSVAEFAVRTAPGETSPGRQAGLLRSGNYSMRRGLQRLQEGCRQLAAALRGNLAQNARCTSPELTQIQQMLGSDFETAMARMRRDEDEATRNMDRYQEIIQGRAADTPETGDAVGAR